jgi:hypothetical protein
MLIALARHQRGEWGELDNHDKAVNEAALRKGERLLSAHTSTGGARFWIITEANRETTTLLLPSEY